MSADGDHRFRAPDVLVLGGGGVLGIAWMAALLAALDEAAGFDARECESFVGTSAGAVLCASLASGRHPRDQLGALPAAAPSAEFSARGGPSPVARALRLGGALS
ncbi:MAG: patatin-like phospholipase family protein, partial [Solirubrobacteraceae bacterium]